MRRAQQSGSRGSARPFRGREMHSPRSSRRRGAPATPPGRSKRAPWDPSSEGPPFRPQPVRLAEVAPRLANPRAQITRRSQVHRKVRLFVCCSWRRGAERTRTFRYGHSCFRVQIGKSNSCFQVQMGIELVASRTNGEFEFVLSGTRSDRFGLDHSAHIATRHGSTGALRLSAEAEMKPARRRTSVC
jgi:hypothetical protein